MKKPTRSLKTTACFFLWLAWFCVPWLKAASQYPPGLYAELYTSKGLIVLQLEMAKTPLTVANFVGLAEGTIQNNAFAIGRPFYNGVVFHRVVPGHVIQAGEPKAGNDSPGYSIPNEIRPDLHHHSAGILGMANGGPHTNGCEFYITLAERAYLDGNYTVFGHVVSGMDVVNAIVQGDELRTMRIIRSGAQAKRFKVSNATFQRQLLAAKKQTALADETRLRDEADYIQKRWPNLEKGDNNLKFQILQSGDGNAPLPGAQLKVRYSGQCLNGEAFVSSVDAGKPQRAQSGTNAEAFVYEIGKTAVTPGFDATIARMLPGEKRLLVVPGEQAYGMTGFYSKSRKGEKRFVISPLTTLVYEIELLDIL